MTSRKPKAGGSNKSKVRIFLSRCIRENLPQRFCKIFWNFLTFWKYIKIFQVPLQMGENLQKSTWIQQNDYNVIKAGYILEYCKSQDTKTRKWDKSCNAKSLCYQECPSWYSSHRNWFVQMLLSTRWMQSQPHCCRKLWAACNKDARLAHT